MVFLFSAHHTAAHLHLTQIKIALPATTYNPTHLYFGIPDLASIDLPNTALHLTRGCNPESLFDYFLSQLDKAGLIAVSVRGIPNDVGPHQLLPEVLGESLGNGRSMAYVKPDYRSLITDFSNGYRKHFTPIDQNFIHSLASQSSFLYDFDLAPEGSQDFYYHHGVRATMVVPVILAKNKNWKLRFVLHSQLDNHDLSHLLSLESALFWNELRHLCLELMTEHEDHFHPPINSSLIIHPKSLQVNA
ncbi:hypothetical protein [Endozoicomonas ascidiicola]|uniref:hypothetical protein n=1 Tax=Endozoicomonas ascidiicola TaxID=1698521 RepID=UPI000836CA54|nr:hypothetical protein [Endozoicomonas ascidiicola]